MALEAAPFNDIAATEGLVATLIEIVGNDVGNLVAPNGTVTNIPAIMTGGSQVPSANFPRITIDYQGDSGGQKFADGYVTLEDPENPPETVDIPYYDQYLTYMLTLTLESGSKDSVLESYADSVVNNKDEQSLMSSSNLARKIRKNLMIKRVRDLVHTNTNSTVRLDNIQINPTYPLDQTQIQDTTVLTLTLDTIDRVYDYQGGVFDTILYSGELKRHPEDNNPIQISGQVGPVNP